MPSAHRPCTGSRDDPEVLTLLDHPSAEDDYAASGLLVERVHADLVLYRVDEVAELGREPRGVPAGTHVALEDAQLDAGSVAGQQRGHVLAPAVVGNVVGDQVSHGACPCP